METPRRSKLSCNNMKLAVNFAEKEDTEYSPIFFPSTQESNEEIDVLWDWHSPQTSQRKRMKQKRLLPHQSPNFTIKRPPLCTQNTNLDKLKDELRVLKEELAVPDDESVLCVSPLQEFELKGHENSVVEQEPDGFDDWIDDEQLVLFSQKIENEIKVKQQQDFEETLNLCDANDFNTSGIDELINKYTKTKDSPGSKIKRKVLPRTMSDNTYNSTFVGKETQRTKSFDLSTITESSTSGLPKSKLDEIERKRLEALAKLEAKKRQNRQKVNNVHRTKSIEISRNSQDGLLKKQLDAIEGKRLEALARLEAKKRQDNPIVISPDEIEKKRLEALAKREVRRLQEIVEKNRQEALKKLRMKNATCVKGGTFIKKT